MQPKVVQVKHLTDLSKAAAEVLNFVKNDKILLFEGEMAAGKTTLIKEVCSLVGVTEPVSSPTYSLVNEYVTATGEVIYHFDFYRIKHVEEALDMGVLEYLDSGNFCFIEWAENIKPLWPESVVQVVIEKGIAEARTITLKKI